jgi:dTDP-4-dehydrorhamnose reductase
MKIYVTGSRGMVGSRFLEILPKDLIPLTPEIDKLDITNNISVSSFFKSEKPDVTLHFAAFTDVGGGEAQRGNRNGSCWKINVEGSSNLAEACKKYNSHLIHISTDYCFSGSEEDPGPYSEDHTIEKDEKKLTWYGFTKAEAEREVTKTLGNNFSIVRLIYPVRGKFDAKLDYIRKPLSLFDQGKLYPLFTDQQISITYIDEACQAINKIIEGKIYGIFHVSTPDTTTPFELINYVIEKARGIKNAVTKSSLDDFLKTVDNPVRYPKFGGLKVEQTERKLGIKFRTWKQTVDELVKKAI